ncbi:hypothetical protein [Pseudomonas sp. LB3P31]
MNNNKSRTVGQRVLAVFVAIGTWLPLIWLVFFLYVPIRNTSLAVALGMDIGSTWFLVMEVFAILLLIVYALWVRPWKYTGRVNIEFIIYVYGASVATLLFANFIFGWIRVWH